jgi:hypothetical protein
MTVVQTGNVTPGHLATWQASGVVGDGGPILASNKVLAAMFSANFNTAGDQAILLPFPIKAFQLTGIVVTNASVSMTTAVGGFYPAAAKAGSAIVAAGQVYSALTSKDLLLQATLTSFANTARFSSNNLPLVFGPNSQNVLAIYFSLTTAQGGSAVADIYLIGIDLSPPS